MLDEQSTYPLSGRQITEQARRHYEEFGEEVKACIQLLGDAAVTSDMEKTLQEYCRSNLSHLKCPRSIDFVDQLPREANGKLYKRLLKLDLLLEAIKGRFSLKHLLTQLIRLG